MQIKKKNKPTFKLKYEVDVPFNKNCQFPIYVIRESHSKNFLAIMVEFQFYLLANNKIILQFQCDECNCCFSDDEKYLAIIFKISTIKILLFDLEKKIKVWVKNSQDFRDLPILNFYKDYIIFMGKNQLFRYSIDGKLQILQIFKKSEVSYYSSEEDEDDISLNDGNQSSDGYDEYQYENDDYQSEEDFECFEDRCIFQAKLHDCFFLYTRHRSNLHYPRKDYTKSCYIFDPINLKIVKSFVCHCICSIMSLSQILILQTQFSDDKLNTDNLFVVRDVINQKILRRQKIENLIIQQFKTIVIKMALYCFNLSGFYKIDFSTGKLQFQTFSYPSFVQNSIKPCNRSYLSEEPYFYASFTHKDNDQKQKTLFLYKLIF